MNILGFFQRLGRALQLPIAVLPVAALLLRFGQPDLLNVAFIAQAGGAIFDNLALIFAIGVASSWSKDSAGAAALAGLSCGFWRDMDEIAALRRSQRMFLPERPQADCDAYYRLWKRAVSRAADWIEH